MAGRQLGPGAGVVAVAASLCPGGCAALDSVAVAEGTLARDTPFAAQVLDVEKVLDERMLRQVLTVERRADLAGLRGGPAGQLVP